MGIFDDASVMITGGTGSFGKAFATSLLRDHHPKKVIIFSRDELKQHDMQNSPAFKDDRLRFFIGDVRDGPRLHRAMSGADVVVHAAALKQVPACEYNPIEAVRTNIVGATNIIDAAIDSDVPRVLALSTDKATNPANLYGGTKLVMEKLIVQANAYSGGKRTRFSCVRYGNVVGSRGSVVPLFLEQGKTGKVTVTDERMTRFWITLGQGAKFVQDCIARMKGGEIFVPKIPSTNIMDLVKVLAPTCRVEKIGIRGGEKLHEALIGEDEARHSRDMGDHYVIQPTHPWWGGSPIAGQSLPEGFTYTSANNRDMLSIAALQKLLQSEGWI
ncbi:MAG: UDP-N-acetylglucosamine 4,6-dehydratase (inverting) [Thermoplasmatota archaeon]